MKQPPSSPPERDQESSLAPERSLGAAKDDKDFEFSNLVIGEQVPFNLPLQRVERTWARLAAGQHARTHRGPRRSGAWVALAACAATFAVGVWVGEGGGLRSGVAVNAPRVMSAEPVGQTLPSAAALSQARHGEGNEVAVRSPEPSDVPVANAALHASETRGVIPARLNNGLRDGSILTPASTALVAAPVHTSEAVVALTAASITNPGWQRLANNGDYEGALVEIGAAGGFERILQTASAEQLMLLSDVTRATGQQQRALAALRRIVSEHASDPVAPLAALNMGNLLDKMGDGAGATQAFAVYRALSPKGDFAEDALVRQIRSAVSAGQQDLARRLVRQYETDFPEGRRADEVARWAEQIPTQSDSVDAGAAEESAQ